MVGSWEIEDRFTAHLADMAPLPPPESRHTVGRACAEGYVRVSLETGTDPFFAAPHRLHARHGFEPCPPFGGYAEDPHRLFMTLDLSS